VKYLKMIGLAAVAAMALMAFVGAGTASADEICTVAANPCSSKITKVEASLVGSAKLEGGEITLDTCTAGGVTITSITGGAGVKPSGSVTTADLTWGTSKTPCTSPTTTIKGGTVDASEASAGGTTLTATGIEVTINNFLVGSCTYGVGGGLDLGSVANGGNELVINKNVIRTAGGPGCPAEATWNATYKITNHTAVYYITN